MEATDIIASKEVVGIFDGTVAPWFFASFYQCQLAPDGKIYINAPNGVDVMHVINQPNEKGLSCDFQQHSIQLPTYNAFSMPNFPYFRLGALEGSPCDTIGVNAVYEAPINYGIEMSPNPASAHVNVTLHGNHSAVFSLRTATRQCLMNIPIGFAENHVPLAGVPLGLYFYEVKHEGRLLGSGKLVVGVGQ